MKDPFRLDGRCAVVTGAGKGIGGSITLQLARAGADVVISSRTEDDLTSLSRSWLGRKATPVLCDVTQTAGWRILPKRPLLSAALIFGLIMQEGCLMRLRDIARTPEDRWDAQMNLNLKALFIACQVAAANMTEGAIINISSSSAKAQGNIKNGPYGASKAAVNSLTQPLRLSLAWIRVNAVAPGLSQKFQRIH